MSAERRPVRVLLFSTLFPSAERPVHGVFVETRLRELRKLGQVEVRVVAPVPWFPFTHARWGAHATMARTPAVEWRDGVEVRHPRYPLLPKVGMSSAPLLMALALRGTVQRLRDEGFDFDLIDAHYYYPDGVAAALLAKWFDRPLVVTARGSDVNLVAEHALPRRMMRWAARRASASVGVSAALVERMRSLGFPADRLQVMRNGVDLDRFQPLDQAAMRRELGLPVGVPLLLTVGNLHEHKGQRLTLEALALVRTQPGMSQARLLVVGTGPDADWLARRAQQLGLSEALHLVGSMPNTALARWYSAADVLVLASSREGWPNVLLEAMACGTPVVATRVGGVPEILAGDQAGRMVGERTAQALADALGSLWRGRPERQAVRRHAEQFSWDATSRLQVQLFRSLLPGA